MLLNDNSNVTYLITEIKFLVVVVVNTGFREMNQIYGQSDNLISCDYYDIPEFKKMKIREQQDLSILHLNISSISAHINDLRNFLDLVNQKIDIICISRVEFPQRTLKQPT